LDARVSLHPRSLFSLAEHLERLSKDGDPLEVLARTVEFERFRPLLVKGLGYGDGTKGGRPAFDPVAMFKVLVVQAQHNIRALRC
jgi:hypothetical protein